ncbi:tyrosine-type recombinase/integrase [Azorhizobium doebereinerae]|uniref:tyrosine-type recombinase/integrase n=1 Tax=Azorhizobium doebereinerae TaxID=281091 RepID=UPI00048CAC03|nr:site-specific integrase [Azorhizobium doebereinerae]
MGRTIAEAPLTTRSARSRLQHGMHWRTLSAEVHLGYRKGIRSGKWVARWRTPDGGYSQETVGNADDELDADGEVTLNFAQAERQARDLVELRRADEKAERDGPAPTVRTAAEAYVEAYEARHRAMNGGSLGRKAARGQLTRHVLTDVIAEAKLHELRRDELRAWRKRLADRGLAVATVRRICNDFRAALNAAAEAHHSRLPAAFPLEVKAGLASSEQSYSPVAREAQVLPDADVRRIIAAAWEVDGEFRWEGDLARLVIVLAATGARFSQVTRLTVGDVQAAQCRLMVPASRKGKGKKVGRTGVPVGEDVIDALRPAIAGRVGSATLLERWRHKQTSPTVWERVGRGPWGYSAEFSGPWKEITVRAGMPAGVVPYALRHSAIVRGLRHGLPIRLVAALHDTSSAMIEQHYSAFIVSALDEIAARAVVPLTAMPASVQPLRAVRT